MRRRGVAYTASAGVYKLPTTPENNMQAGHTDSNTDKLCPRQLHAMHTQTPCTQLSFLTSPQSIATVVIRLRRLRLSGEPTSHHTQVRAGWSNSLNDVTLAL